MSGLSEERRREIESWHAFADDASEHADAWVRFAWRAVRDLLAESAALRTEQQNLRGERERLLGLLNHEERARLGYHGLECAFRRGADCDCETEQYRRAVGSRNIVYGLVRDIAKAAGYDGDEEGYIPRLTEHIARLAAPASPDDLARVADELAAEVCRCADCVPYGQPIPCDRARIADRLRNPLAVALARLTPPTGPSVDGERVRAAWVAKLRADLESLIATRVTPPTAGPSFLHIFDALAALLFLAHTSAPPTGTAAGHAGETTTKESKP